MLLNTLIQILPQIISQLNYVLFSRMKSLYNEHLYFQLVIPFQTYLLQKHPRIFHAVVNKSAKMPSKQQILTVLQLINEERKLYHAHFDYKLDLISITSLPEDTINHFLQFSADHTKTFQFLDYVIIANNLNPRTFLYEDLPKTRVAYLWVAHQSYGDLLDAVIKQNLPNFRSSMLSLRSGSPIQLPQKLLENHHLANLNSRYNQNIIEMLRYQISQYQRSLVSSIRDQSSQERKDAQKKFSQNSVHPWQVFQDFSEYLVDAADYIQLLTREPVWVRAILLKIIRESTILQNTHYPVSYAEIHLLLRLIHLEQSVESKSLGEKEQSEGEDLVYVRMQMVSEVLRAIQTRDNSFREVRFKVFEIQNGNRIFEHS